ncbi:hypothetical protein GCM10018953_07660 [Streptosporangium nondiastaticum]|uniref:hypothetical protein n=1 Tax=Streptosporangium TaxID=2000 RepID=UPI0031F752E8
MEVVPHAREFVVPAVHGSAVRAAGDGRTRPVVAAHLVQIGPQRPYDPGTTLLSRDEAHAPMWIPGAIAVLAGNLLEGALLLLLGG